MKFKKSIIKYTGLAEKVKQGYTIFFPDFPGFGSAGKTLEVVKKNARDGLISHIELMLQDGETLPRPSPLEHVLKSDNAKKCIPLIIDIIATN